MNLNLEKTKRKLSLFQKLVYHRIAIIIFSFPLIFLITEILNGRLSGELEPLHKICFLLIIIALLIIWKKDKDLKLKSFQTQLNKNDLKQEIEKIAKEFNWNTISLSDNHFEFKIKASSNFNNIGIEFKKYINLIIVFQSGQFCLNAILDMDNMQLFQVFDLLGETKQWTKTTANRLKTHNS